MTTEKNKITAWPAAMRANVACLYLGCSRTTFYRLYYGKIPSTDDGRYRRLDLDNALKQEIEGKQNSRVN